MLLIEGGRARPGGRRRGERQRLLGAQRQVLQAIRAGHLDVQIGAGCDRSARPSAACRARRPAARRPGRRCRGSGRDRPAAAPRSRPARAPGWLRRAGRDRTTPARGSSAPGQTTASGAQRLTRELDRALRILQLALRFAEQRQELRPARRLRERGLELLARLLRPTQFQIQVREVVAGRDIRGVQRRSPAPVRLWPRRSSPASQRSDRRCRAAGAPRTNRDQQQGSLSAHGWPP